MLAVMLLLAAPALSPGLWESRNEPGKASLNGRALDDLPIGEIKTDRVCLTPAESRDPATWLARDVSAECKLGRAEARGGVVRVEGVCEATAERGPGRISLTGRYDPASYDVDFATSIGTPQGTMTFSGRMTGRRVGECDAPSREKSR